MPASRPKSSCRTGLAAFRLASSQSPSTSRTARVSSPVGSETESFLRHPRALRSSASAVFRKALISGSVYMLLAAKLQKFGGITIMGLVMGLFFFVSGHFVLSFAANIICGVAADLVAAAGKYRSKKLLLASYVVFSYGLTGPILPLWFMKSAYIANLTARGKDAAYIDTLFAPINSGSFVVSMLAILICALVGGFFGQKMLKKHFEKAGIVA